MLIVEAQRYEVSDGMAKPFGLGKQPGQLQNQRLPYKLVD